MKEPLGGYAFENALSIHIPDFVHVLRKPLDNGRRSQELHSPSKAQEPAEELFADINGCRDNEMVFIWLFINHAIRAEAFNNGIRT